MYIWQYLVGNVVKKRGRKALAKSAHQLCSHLSCAGFNLFYVHCLIFVLCAALNLCYVPFFVSFMCSC